MKSSLNTPHAWSTVSFGGAADTSPIELSSLGDHLGICKSPNGHWFAMHCAGEAMRGFVASRFVTTVVAIALLIGIASLFL